jgi:hypothetical protein
MNGNLALALVGSAALLAASIPSMFAAAAQSPALGTTTTTTTPPGPATTSTQPEFVLPAGFEYLIDDSGRITVAVPTAWTDISTAVADVDGSAVPDDQRGD